MISPDDAVTQWIDELKAGDSIAAEKLWQTYFQQIVELARRKLEGAKRGAADEEDVALSAFKSFCLGANEGRFPKLIDRNSLWSLLMAITAHKSVDHIRRENRQKRGGTGKAATESEEPRQAAVPLSQIIQAQASPEFAAQVSEQFAILLNKLERADDRDLVEIALAKMQGHSNDEVAQQIGCVRRTIERKIRLIRLIWENEVEASVE